MAAVAEIQTEAVPEDIPLDLVYEDEHLFVVNKRGAVQRLVGHRSRISKLRFYNHRLYSSSFDGTLNFWELNLEKPEPMTLYSGNCWIMHFAFDKSRSHVWIGDQKGNVAEVLVSVPVMVERIRKMKAMDTVTKPRGGYQRQAPRVTAATPAQHQLTTAIRRLLASWKTRSARMFLSSRQRHSRAVMAKGRQP